MHLPVNVTAYQTCRDYLFGLRNRGSKLGLERMQLLVQALGDPQRNFPVIHVAGTNGKGSTCAMLESIFRHAGYRTGLFTSPHLVFLGERIQCDRQPLTAAEITAYTAEIEPVAQEIGQISPDHHPTFFEFMTAMAFMHFSRVRVDIAIIETGLGGRLDATNVVDPVLTAITSIGLDHVELLGDTLGKIAAEKAGILKPGRPVVIGALPAEAEAVIRGVAAERGCALHAFSERFGAQSDDWPKTRLPGRYQRINAGVATLIVELLHAQFPKLLSAIEPGLLQVEWAGRWQLLPLISGQQLILDATHNAEGVVELERNLRQLVSTDGQKPVVLVGVIGIDRARALLPVVAQYAERLITLVPKQPRACSHAELCALVSDQFTGSVEQGDVESLFSAPSACSLPIDRTLVATGSIYLIGEILARLGGEDGGDSLQDGSVLDPKNS